jgi:serine/threonine protein kinase
MKYMFLFQVQIVQELCDFGSLREALDRKAFHLPDGSVNYPAVLETALDIAKGMKHLHGSNILHADLKVSGLVFT